MGDSKRPEAVSKWGSSLFQRFLLAVFLFAVIGLASAQTKPLPPGPMQAKIKATCTQCHNSSRITEQHLTKQEWSAELDKMAGLGAEIPDADRPALLSYLSKNFGPEKTGKTTAKTAARKNAEETK